MATVSNFVIYDKPLGCNQIESMPQLPPNSLEYTYIASAINIAVGILEQPTGRHFMTELALSFDSSGSGLNRFGGQRVHARAAIDLYLTKIRAFFPTVVIEHQTTDPNMLAFYVRSPWQGTLRSFNTRGQMVFVNAPRVSDMLRASGQVQQFKQFQFMFATTLAHEVGGHMLITFISDGRPETPPHITAPSYGDFNTGESGRWLELRLFGGTTEYYADPRLDRHQSGFPFQIDDSNRAWRIHQSVIDNVCRHREIVSPKNVIGILPNFPLLEYQLPFVREGGPIDPRVMRNMGRAFPVAGGSGSSSGGGQQAMMARQEPLRLRGSAGYTVQLRELAEVPTNPHRRLVVVG